MSGVTAATVATRGVGWDVLLAAAPAYSLLQSSYFSDPAALERDSLVVSRGDIPLFVLPLSQTEAGWTSHPEAFAASLLPLDGADPADLWPAVQAVAAVLPAQRITLRLRPRVVSPDFADAESGAWRMLRSMVTQTAAIMAIDVQRGLVPSSRRRRAMSKAKAVGMTVGRAHDSESVRAGWSCVEDVYARRELSGLLSAERVERLAGLPGDVVAVFIAKIGDQVVGTALGYRLGSSYRLPVYGTVDGPGAAGATELIIQAAFEAARSQGCEFLDLGTCADPRTGSTVAGIASFKSEMGAWPRPVEHLTVDLR